MASLTIWNNFSKRKNSTKQPTGGSTIDVKLKENCSLENPVFICNNISGANYCQFQGNYYFVEDVVFVTSSICELHCSMDALATNKSAIVGAPAHVMYYTHNNTEIVDNRLSTKTTATIQSSSASLSVFDGEVVVVAISGINGISYFAMTPANARALTTKYEDWYGREFTDETTRKAELEAIAGDTSDPDAQARAIDALNRIHSEEKNSVNASVIFANILSAHWLPVNYATGGTAIKIGQYDPELSGNEITDPIIKQSGSLSIPWQATDWRRNAPYHQIYFNSPIFGTIPISPASIMGQTSINWSLSINMYSGDTSLILRAGTAVISNLSSNISAPFAIGSSNIARASAELTQMQLNVNTLTGLVSSVSSIIGGEVGKGALGAVNTYTKNEMLNYQLSNDLTPQPTLIGGVGGSPLKGVTGANVIECVTVFHDTTVTPSSISALHGTPYNGIMNIPSSGYVQTANANIPSIAYGGEKSKIDSMLNSGVYIE